MKIVRHDAYIKKRKRWSIVIAVLGFLMLTGTLFMALNPRLVAISYGLMLGGFILFNIGMQQVGRWSRNPRNDQVLDFQLKSLPDRYTLIHYPDVGGKRLDHILVHPGGLVTVIAKEVEGQIEQKGKRWRKLGLGLKRLFAFSGPQLGNPSAEADVSIATLEKFLSEKQMDVDVDGAIVFLHPQAELSITDPDYPVLHVDELPSFVTSLPADQELSSHERETLVALLRGAEVPVVERKVARRRPVRRRAE